ncbi:hypothetical protein JJQ60_05735 [Aquimarina mytili]|uniref:Uncharacterized protein n=1 Tax=Aquimarina mytili TaxID=874423 RepID=A0A937DAR3_9FLAO|nr:hypothetical protein [Aquimarina mytili]
MQCKTHNSQQNLLITEENWRSEIIDFPLEFAPSLEYFGTEHIRFAPGWGKKNAADYFSYAFLWILDQDPELSSKKLESDMETYFDGLIKVISKEELKSNIDITKSKAFFEKVNDSVYAGKILTYDPFTTRKDVNLNIIVTYRYCTLEKKHLALFNISPQAPEHQIWKKMKKIAIDLTCE